MLLTGSDVYRVYRPSRCDLRLYLHHKGVEGAPPGPFEEVLRRLGERHEKAHLATFPQVVHIDGDDWDVRERLTLEAVLGAAPVIYQGVFRAWARLADRDCRIVGIPDFLIREGSGYVIRDVKMSRRINDKDHPEILRQLRLYGWLYERAAGSAPVRLEVFAGTGEIVPVDSLAKDELESELAGYVQTVHGAEAPFAPVGWTKCGDCTYQEFCWKEAETNHHVALIPKVDQGLARALRDAGIASYDELLGGFDLARLADLRRPWGKKMQKVGESAATTIMRSARALKSGEDIAIAPPVIPDARNFVMFDLEGLPPHLDELEKIYLWGVQVFGDKPSEFMGATAGFGPEGDREGWEAFLGSASRILTAYGAIPFVHWHHYERTKLKMYVERHGDRDGVAAAVIANLFDLLPATQNAVALPLPSYSLKVVERHVGFERSQTEYGGDWAMARYIEATETSDEKVRNEVLAAILKYNAEDLAATWAVLCWLRDLGRRMQTGAGVA